MRKYLKHFLVLAVLFVVVGFSSCSDLDEDFADWAFIVTVNEIEKGKYDFTLDNGERVWAASPENINLKPKYDRAIIFYSLLDEKKEGYDQVVKLYRFYDVLTKGPIYIPSDDKVKQDSIGNDYIKVHSMWEGGDYLNISFGYNAAGEEAHMVNLVSEESDMGVGKDKVKLQFRHNKNGDHERYPAEGYVSFDLSPYKLEGRSKVDLEISWIDFGGQEKTKTIEYEFDSTDKKQSAKIVNETSDTNLNIY